MGSELARAETSTREGVASGLKQLIDIAIDVAGEDSDASAKDDAIFTLSAMIGAITMSRLIEDAKLSKYILDVMNHRLLEQSKKNPTKMPAFESAARKKKVAQ
jgi:TetR/AcrR family transcriptional repressor of nem operon